METVPISCAHCHTPFTPTNKRGRPSVYCSALCRYRAWYRPCKRRRTKCEVCGKIFMGRSNQRKCSQACRAKIYRACDGCGVTGWLGRGRYCSQACADRDAAKRLARETRTCGRCLQPFTPRRLDQRYCSTRCQNRNDCNRKRHRRRAAYAEDVTIAYLMERDGHRCGICGKPIDITIEHPNPMSASIDHIVPLSKGGSHTRVNCQPAHLGCNSRKHNRANGVQLRLIA